MIYLTTLLLICGNLNNRALENKNVSIWCWKGSWGGNQIRFSKLYYLFHWQGSLPSGMTCHSSNGRYRALKINLGHSIWEHSASNIILLWWNLENQWMEVLAIQSFAREEPVKLIRERPRFRDCTVPSWMGEGERDSECPHLKISQDISRRLGYSFTLARFCPFAVSK